MEECLLSPQSKNSEIQAQNIGNRILLRRRSLDMNQSLLAERTNLSRAHISAIENGKASYKINDINKIALALDLSPIELIGNLESDSHPQRSVLEFKKQRDWTPTQPGGSELPTSEHVKREETTSLWDKALLALEVVSDPAAFASLRNDTEYGFYRDGHLVVFVTDEFTAKKIQRKYSDALSPILQLAESDFRQLSFLPDKKFQKQMPSNIGMRFDPYLGVSNEEHTSEFVKLDDDLTFDTFVIGPSNKSAYDKAKLFSEAPDTRPTPLLICGKTGLGKTHLLDAIMHDMRLQDDLEVFSVNMESVVNGSDSMDPRRLWESIKRKCLAADVIVADDIHRIAGKEETQYKFLRLFETLIENRKQIVLSSNGLPGEIENFLEGLASRFCGGMIAHLNPLNFDTKIAILQRFSESVQYEFSSEVLKYLANKTDLDVRQLRMVLNEVIHLAASRRLAINLKTARLAISEIFPDGFSAG
jgi:chromosomal replication initiator protein DnaA